ncbi:MAG TPA: hypothetical protein VL996_15020 [Methylocella sp.]|nr:hypothetical protein [Methylocella sp.]
MSEPVAAKSVEHPLAPSRFARLWLRELPYIIVLVLTLLGVAYTSISHQPLAGYWEFLALAMGVVCIGTGWLHSPTKEARFRMIWTQVLHWLAFLVAMNIVVLSDVQRLLTAPGTGLALLMLLALGTFVAGVHIAWQICILGIIMALAVPAIAWLTSYALFLTLAAAALLGIAVAFFWRHSDARTLKLHAREESHD